MVNSKGDRLFWLILILPLLLALLNLRFLWLQCWNPSDTSNPESLAIFFVERVAEGKDLFLDYHQPPFNLLQYTPVYHLLLGKTARAFDLNREKIFIVGRIFTFGCTLLIGMLLFLRAGAEEKKFSIAASGALFFLSSYILWPWAVTNRPDILGVLFSLAGFLIYTKFASSPVRWFAVLLFVLAFFTKQYFLSAPFAIFLWLFADRKWKELILFSASYGLSILMILLAMHSATSGLSTLNLVEPNFGSPMKFQNVRLVTLMFLQISPLPIILAAVGVAIRGWRKPETIYFAVSFVYAILCTTKLGSNVNYFIEPLAVGCLLVPTGLRSLINSDGKSLRAFVAAAFLILLFPSINFMIHSLRTLHFSNERLVSKKVMETQGPIITDNPRFALISRKSFFIDPFPMSYLEKKGKWDSTRIVEMLQSGQIEMIVLTLPVENALSWQGFKRIPESILAAIQKYYRYEITLDGYSIYLPRKELSAFREKRKEIASKSQIRFAS